MIDQGTPVASPRAEPKTAPKKKSGRAWWLIPAGLVAVGVVVGGYYYVNYSGAHAATSPGADTGSAAESNLLEVEVVTPKKGGLERTTVQPGDVRPFEWADLRTRVSGYLKSQKVDIGDHVKKGDVLATIDAPDRVQDFKQAETYVGLKKKQADLARARVKSAEASVVAAKKMIEQAKKDVERYVAEVTYRKTALARVIGLVNVNALERRLQDEEQERHDESVAAEQFARSVVQTRMADEAKAEAELEDAKVEVKVAEEQVKVAEAERDKAKVYVDFAELKSPYTGVITRRSFHVGDFIRADSEGTTVPILTVARTDLMRVVIQVPDTDVPFVHVDDKASIKIQALQYFPPFKGKVSRFAYSEDPSNRTMRTEVDLENPDNKLREGMYGIATILLLEKSPDNLTIPASAIVAQDEEGKAQIWVVREGKAEEITVKVGQNNGVDVEILKGGLRPEDQVIALAAGGLTNDLPVKTVEYKPKGEVKKSS
ncbi:MAG TPA: efflux RND transporter periplasmic adaptor subunit [Isosphaeraceae bacterium]|jgi:RND family efflux transporter MFP subunit|nr:efflux RND transporter periplasmic adaptor subunit [Isosphaeraceae bacterium]